VSGHYTDSVRGAQTDFFETRNPFSEGDLTSCSGALLTMLASPAATFIFSSGHESHQNVISGMCAGGDAESAINKQQAKKDTRQKSKQEAEPM
jgi:hypothetical protein